jgi:C-methyltransferase-like protein
MNYAGIRSDLIRFVVARNPAKRGKYMSSNRLPILDETRLKVERLDYVVLLPWNMKAEVQQKLGYMKEGGGCLGTVVPRMEIVA